MWREFKAFLFKHDVVALAVAVVIGAALNGVVQALVNDVIMPIVGLVQPSVEWKSFAPSIGRAKFPIGDLASALLNFVIVGFVVWRIAKIVARMNPEKPPATKACVFCKMACDIAATRCPHCTSQLAV